MIDIYGYVTELNGENGFKIKVTSDRVEHLSFNDIQVSKEVRILISPRHYPSDDNSEFKELAALTASDDPRINKINKCRSLSNALRKGDQVKCYVFAVEKETRNEVQTLIINNRRKDIKTYADFDLLLYPNIACFQRLEVDSKKSLKFRKQWRYTCINREKCEKITGYSFNGYRNKWWINKNPKMIFPILWWIQVKTIVSNLLSKPSLTNIITIIGAVVTIIGVVVAIWSLFLKN